MPARGPTLLGDIGGTHARFALANAAGIEPPLVLATAAFDSVEAAVARFLSRRQPDAPVTAVAVCAAGPLHDGAVALTNGPWIVSVDGLGRAAGVAKPLLVNDFTALAAALPALEPGDLEAVGGGTPRAGAARAVLGPGTGLGVSGLIPGAAGGEAYLCGEGGHVSLASASPREDRIIAFLRERHGRVSAEHVLCGPGLCNLYEAIAAIDGAPVARPAPAAIARAASSGDAVARECVAQFCGWLGELAGDLALTLGARGGVYLGGGIVPAWGRLFDRARFRQRFEAKGRYRRYLAEIPTYIITAAHPAMRGLQRLLERRG